jgi:hypothetical protein
LTETDLARPVSGTVIVLVTRFGRFSGMLAGTSEV